MRAFKIVDVFTDTPFQGNPVAVVLRADGLSDEDMQRIAAWTNLSETTFHLAPTAPGADYRLRIFTPRSELPFAGHPTLGSAHALIEAGLIAPRNGAIVQECSVGLVPVSVDPATRALQLQMPPAQIHPLSQDERARLASILGAPLADGAEPALVDVGARWIVTDMGGADTVLALQPDLAASAALEQDMRATGVTVFGRHGASVRDGIEVRSFAPSCGVGEDPVCGSGNGSVAAYLLAGGALAEGDGYAASQGRCVGRRGQVGIRIAQGKVFVGGSAVTTVDGTIAA